MEKQHGSTSKRCKKSTCHSNYTQFPSPQLDHDNQIPSLNSPNQEPKPEESSEMSIILSSSSSSSEAPDLHWSILFDVLSRLPIKTLMQCSYVCKSWRHLISESYLYRLYCLHTPTTLILQLKGSSLDTLREILLIESSLPIIDISSSSSSSSSSSLTRKMRLVSNKNPIEKGKEDDFRFQLGNGCNGLICLREISTREPRLVCNPIMGQFVFLPISGSISAEKVVSGFGFCSRNNRYKVLRIFRGEFDRWRVEIYDLGGRYEWREIGDSPFQIQSRIPGFYTNNCLHWILEDSPILICCFDFVEEVFRTIPDPPIYSSGEKSMYRWSNLGILGGGCLSICASDAEAFRPDVQVWVMEEYGVAKSWALRLSIRDPAVDWWDPYRWIQVINFLRNGEILMLCGHRYVLAYNLRERRFRSIEGLEFPAIAHVPSFISLEDVLRDDLGTGSLIVRYL